MGLTDRIKSAWRAFSDSDSSATTVAAIPESSDTKAAIPSRGVKVGGDTLEQLLGGKRPGAWASDHRAESEKFTGWRYIAIRSICLQGMQATVAAYQQTPETLEKNYRRRLKRPALKSTYNEQDDKGEPLPFASRLMTLLRKPNPKMSGGMFTYRRLQQLNLTGRCLVWNVPNRLGQTVQRYVIPTAIAEPRDATPEFPNGFYYVRPVQSRYLTDAGVGWFTTSGFGWILGRPIPVEETQLTLFPHPVVLDDGQSPVAAGATWADTADMLDKRRWSHMRSGSRPSVIVQAPDDYEGDENDLARAEAKFNKKWSGPENHGGAKFVQSGQITMADTNPREMDYGGAFTQLRDAEMAIHGVAPVAAGVTDGGSYAAFYASLLQTTKLTVQPQLSMLADEDTIHLAPQFGNGIVIEMLAPQIDDPSILENQLRTDLSGKVRRRNEIRALRGLDPVEGPEGEEFVGGTALGAGQGGVPHGQQQADESTTGVQGAPRMATRQDLIDLFPKSDRFELNGHAMNGHAKEYP